MVFNTVSSQVCWAFSVVDEHLSMSPSPVGWSASLVFSSGDVLANDRIFIPGPRRFLSLEHYKKHFGEQCDALCTVTLNVPMSFAQLAVFSRILVDLSRPGSRAWVGGGRAARASKVRGRPPGAPGL